jgi:hypothetical protein
MQRKDGMHGCGLAMARAPYSWTPAALFFKELECLLCEPNTR